jgi:hypothetical protein
LLAFTNFLYLHENPHGYVLSDGGDKSGLVVFPPGNLQVQGFHFAPLLHKLPRDSSIQTLNLQLVEFRMNDLQVVLHSLVNMRDIHVVLHNLVNMHTLHLNLHSPTIITTFN